MSNNMKVLLVGPGNMGREYCKVLLAQGRSPTVIGRGEGRAMAFEREYGVPVMTGGVDKALQHLSEIPEYAIVASTFTDLSANAVSLIKAGVKKILVEKPAGINYREVKQIADVAAQRDAHVWVAYNRRFYSSVSKAVSIIDEDGGLSSMNFEFTEWSNSCEKATARYDEEHREAWFVANSTHVVDLAFFFGGQPVELSSYTSGGLSWHKTGCVYAGAGVTDKKVLFSYQANWAAPGRWGLELMTHRHRLYLRPMEKLSIQEINSIAINPVEIEDEMECKFKPGLYRQVEAFLNKGGDARLIGINEHLDHMRIYAKMENKSVEEV